ncbi:MAG: hypothetical protein WAT39_16510 [Planctomycetota bacterium]
MLAEILPVALIVTVVGFLWLSAWWLLEVTFPISLWLAVALFLRRFLAWELRRWRSNHGRYRSRWFAEWHGRLVASLIEVVGAFVRGLLWAAVVVAAANLLTVPGGLLEPFEGLLLDIRLAMEWVGVTCIALLYLLAAWFRVLRRTLSLKARIDKGLTALVAATSFTMFVAVVGVDEGARTAVVRDRLNQRSVQHRTNLLAEDWLRELMTRPQPDGTAAPHAEWRSIVERHHEGRGQGWRTAAQQVGSRLPLPIPTAESAERVPQATRGAVAPATQPLVHPNKGTGTHGQFGSGAPPSSPAREALVDVLAEALELPIEMHASAREVLAEVKSVLVERMVATWPTALRAGVLRLVLSNAPLRPFGSPLPEARPATAMHSRWFFAARGPWAAAGEVWQEWKPCNW